MWLVRHSQRKRGATHRPYLWIIAPAFDPTEELLRAVATFDLAKRILSVEGDVLGAYFPPQPKWYVKPPRIELYWAVIGLVAPLIGTSTPSLTVAVSAHELAHAFTQVGADIEGYRWEVESFHALELTLKEGIAQYYTALAANGLNAWRRGRRRLTRRSSRSSRKVTAPTFRG